MATKFKAPTSTQDMPTAGRERRARGVNFNDVGALGLKHSGGFIREEFLRDLQGANGRRVIREMMDNDPIIGAFLFAVEQAIRQVDWKVVTAHPAPKAPPPKLNMETGEMEEQEAPSDPKYDEARKYANFVDSCRQDMCMTWSDVMTEALSFLPFGWSLLEVTYKVRRGDVGSGTPRQRELSSKYEDGLVGWKKMAPRAQESLRRWLYDPEDLDRVTHMQQFTTEKGTRDISLERCLHFRTKSFKDNPEGRSILRNCYRPWYLKKRIEEVEGIGIERDMAGLPVLVAGENADLWNENDPSSVAARKAAERIVRNIRVDEQMGVLLPFGWELKLLATGGKRSLNTTDVINRYAQHMAMTVLCDFVMLGHTNRMGSFALAKAKTSMFAMSLVGYLNVIRDTFNTVELPRLWRMNGFPMDMLPSLDYTPVDTPSLKDMASYITALAGAGIDFSPAEIGRFLLQQGGIPADLSDLAGRGGTGDMNGNGIPDDQEDDEEDDGDSSSAGGKPTAAAARPKPKNRGVYTGRTKAGLRKTRYVVRRAA